MKGHIQKVDAHYACWQQDREVEGVEMGSWIGPPPLDNLRLKRTDWLWLVDVSLVSLKGGWIIWRQACVMGELHGSGLQTFKTRREKTESHFLAERDILPLNKQALGVDQLEWVENKPPKHLPITIFRYKSHLLCGMCEI